MVTALVSALSHTPVRRDLAMTGEVTLTGEVLAIGGLKEKTMAAAAAGVKTVLIPADNMRDIPELDPEAVKALEIIPCRTVYDVLEQALVRSEITLDMPTEATRAKRPSATRSATGGNTHA
jgi:ATP-dependent Lon protease